MLTKPLSYLEMCDAITEIRLKLQLLRGAVRSLEETVDEQNKGITGGYDLIHFNVIDSLELVQKSIVAQKLAR